MAFSVAGHAEMAALNSRTLLTRVLLNRGSHCIALRTPNSEHPSVTDGIDHSSFLRPLLTPLPNRGCPPLTTKPNQTCSASWTGRTASFSIYDEDGLHEYETFYDFSSSYSNAEKEDLVAGTGDAAGAVGANVETNEAGGESDDDAVG